MSAPLGLMARQPRAVSCRHYHSLSDKCLQGQSQPFSLLDRGSRRAYHQVERHKSTQRFSAVELGQRLYHLHLDILDGIGAEPALPPARMDLPLYLQFIQTGAQFLHRQPAPRADIFEFKAIRSRHIQQLQDNLIHRQRFPLCHTVSAGRLFSFRRVWVNDGPAADDPHRRICSQHKGIFRRGGERCFQPQLAQCRFPRTQSFAFQEHNTGHNFFGAVVDAQARSLSQRFGRALAQVYPHIEHQGGGDGAGSGEHIAAVDVLFLDVGEIDRRPLARGDFLHDLVMHLKPAEAKSLALWQTLNFLSCLQGTGHHRSGDYRPRPFHGEYPVYGQPENAGGGPHPHTRRNFSERLKKSVHSVSCQRRNRKDLCLLQESSLSAGA